MDIFTSVLGHFGPYILFIISLLLCLPQKALLLYVFIGFYMNRAINSSFKKFLKKFLKMVIFYYITVYNKYKDK